MQTATTQTATTPTANLKSKAMLVNLSIGMWSGRKHDAEATREIEVSHDTQRGEAGRFNKMLTSREFLKGITRAGGAGRNFLYAASMPWGDNGDRILPSACYFDFLEKLKAFIDEFNNEVYAAANELENEINRRRLALNGLFKAEEYPTKEEFISKFYMKASFMPLPETEDFRIDISETESNLLKQSIENEINNRITAAQSNIWERVIKQLKKMSERLSDKEAIFRDSLFENLAELIDLLPKFNIANDPNINAACEDLKTLLVNPETVRENCVLRNVKAREVNEMIDRYKDFF